MVPNYNAGNFYKYITRWWDYVAEYNIYEPLVLNLIFKLRSFIFSILFMFVSLKFRQQIKKL